MPLSGTTPAAYGFQLQATSSDGSVVHQQAVRLDVVDYTASTFSPAILAIPDGGTASGSFSLSASGPFNTTVALSCGGLPAGASCSFSPASPVAVTSAAAVPVTVTVSLAPQTALADYAVSVAAAAAGLPGVKTQAFDLRVQSNPDFLLSSAATSLTSLDGAAATANFGVGARDAYSGSLALTCSVIPTGPVCSVSPASGTTFPIAAALTVSPNGARDGTYQVSVNASDSSKSHSLLFTYQVVDFTLSAPSSLNEYITSQTSFTATLTRQNGFTGKVQISCDTSQMPLTPFCSTSPTFVDFSQTPSVNVQVSTAAPGKMPGGTFPLILWARDSKSSAVEESIVNVTVQGFTFVRGQHTEQTVLVGNTSAPFDFTFAPYNGYGLVTQIEPWTCNPAGAICTITPSSTVTPTGAPVLLSMTVTVPVQDKLSLGGDFSFGVLAVATQTYPYNVSVPLDGDLTIHVQDYALLTPNAQFTLTPGSSTQVPITVKEFNGLSVPVTLSCPVPLPPGVTCAIDKPTINANEVALFTFSADNTAPLSLREFDIVGVATPNGQTIQHTLVLYPSIASFSLSINPRSISVPAGGDAPFLVTVNENTPDGVNFEGTISCTSPDPGVTCDSQLEYFGGPIFVSVRTDATATPIGPHQFTVSLTETDGSFTASATATIVNQGPDGLNVVSPNGYELWNGGTHNISWTYTGNPGSTVRIDLVNNGAFTQTIASSVPIGINGAGFYSWQIPNSLPYSEFYQVRITSNDQPSISDVSDDPVWMGEGVNVHYPTAGTVVYNNAYYFIIEYGWSVLGRIQFDLYKGGQFVETLTTSTLSGCFDFDPGCVWDSPPVVLNVTPGTDYSIKATPLDDPSRAVFSTGTFTISTTTLTLTSPNGGEVWQTGTTHAITWNWVGDPVSPGVDVKISLGTDGYPGTTILTPTAPIGANGSGSYLWTIPADFPQSKYYRASVQVYTAQNTGLSSGSAADFAIGAFHSLSITVNGNGGVSSADSLISCPFVHCSAIYPPGVQVTLFPSPGANSQFAGWSGACSGTDDCTVTMNGNLAAIATFTTLAPDFSLSGTPASDTISAGQAADYSIKVIPQGGLTGTVNLSCSGLPQDSTCLFQPNGVTLTQLAVNTTLLISTSARQSRNLPTLFPVSPGEFLFGSFGLGLAGILIMSSLRFSVVRRCKRALRVAALELMLVVGCTGGGGGGVGNVGSPGGGTPAGSYTVSVSAQVGTATHNTTIVLVVQ